MRPPGPRIPRERALAALAGWLFADLMLVIVIVAMGGQSDPLAAGAPKLVVSTRHASPTPKPTPTTAKPSPSPTFTGPPSLERTPQVFDVQAAQGDDATLTRQITAALARYRGRRAGFVMTFGWGSDSGSDTAYATEVNGLLNRIAPGIFPVGTPEQAFIDLGSPSGGAKVEIFLFTGSS